MIRPWIAPFVAILPLLASAQPAPAQKAGIYGDPCADLGSFAVVDAPPPPRGAPIVAGSSNPCADLPGRPQPQVFIDAQVQIGPANPAGTPDLEPGGTPFIPSPPVLILSSVSCASASSPHK